jgi:polysaccharide deacetylase family protein (PEP-CTERM system associated)
MMASAITFTLDLEDNRPDRSGEKRYPGVISKLLDYLDETAIRGTFFVVGNLARADPVLIRRIADAGHELACHSLDHTALPNQTPDAFRSHTTTAKKIIEDAASQKVHGYRAPVFSLTRESIWATDILRELDFTYSSSVVPARNPLYGFPNAPRTPFRWKSGLLEIPAPVIKFGPLSLPFLGGIYFRYLPSPLVHKAAKRNAGRACLWLYCHHYDFDADEPYCRIEGTSTATSVLLWMNRRGTGRKLDRLFASPDFKAAEPLKARVANGEFAAARVFAA